MEKIIFLKNLSENEMKRLEFLCHSWNNKFTNGETPEEETGNILSVIGQTKLLISEKFKQFADLIIISGKSCQTTTKVTVDDLQGFWDLISIQIEDINNKFNVLQQKEASNWMRTELDQKIKEPTNSQIKKKVKKVVYKINKDETKKRLQEAKQAMQERLKQNQCNEENFFI